MAAKSGREQARTTATAQARVPDLSKFYAYKLPPIIPGDFAFHLALKRPGLPDLSLDRMVDTFEWVDEQAILTGNLTAYRTDPEQPATLPVTRGMLVNCSVEWGKGSTYDLWTMRTEGPQYERDTGNLSVNLKDDMALLDGSKRDWWFRKTKSRPYGYTADEIAQRVASELGVQVDQLSKGTFRQELKMRSQTGLAVLKRAYQAESTKTGRVFVIRLKSGKLQIVPIARNPIAYVLSSQIQTALITQAGGQKIPTTVLTGKGHIGKGKSARSISYTEYDRQVVRLLGYSHDTVHFGKVDSSADLRTQVQRMLAKRLRYNSSVSVSAQGIPFIVRGDATQVLMPTEGYSGTNSWVFCTSATHTVQAAVYTTTWDFTYRDPYLTAVQDAAKSLAKRQAKSKKRNLKLKGSSR